VKVLPTVPMVGQEAIGRTIQNLIAQKVIPAIERKGARIFFSPPTATPKHFGFVHFSDWGTMGLREKPYPASAPFFLFLLSGEGLVYVRENWYHLVAGHGIFVPHNCLHFPHGTVNNSVPHGRWLWVNVHPFGAVIHQCCLDDDSHFRSPVYAVVDKRLFWLFQEWEKEAITRGCPDSLVSKSLLLAFFHLLVKPAPIPVSVWAEISLMLPELPATLREAILRLIQNYDAPCRLEDVSKQCGISVFYLCKLFRRHLGTNPRAYAQRLRLKIAKQMLAETGVSPYKVCQLVGYSNYNYFRKQFQRTFGFAPSRQAVEHAKVWSPNPKTAALIDKLVP